MSLFLFISCFVIWKLLKSSHCQNTQVQQTDSFRYTDVSAHVSKAWGLLFFIQIFWAYVAFQIKSKLQIFVSHMAGYKKMENNVLKVTFG